MPMLSGPADKSLTMLGLRTQTHFFPPPSLPHLCDQGPADELIMLGLRTLELWFDSINPEYMEAAMAEVCELCVGGAGLDWMGVIMDVTDSHGRQVSPISKSSSFTPQFQV